MNLQIKFCYYGIIIFLLPMLINILYVILPPKTEENKNKVQFPFLEAIENIFRIAYLLVTCILSSCYPISFRSPFLYLSMISLTLYYIVWIRYFINNRDLRYLNKSFLFVPVPLAVFPVFYFLFAALWLKNIPALVCMLIFGTAHIINTYKKFKKEQ